VKRSLLIGLAVIGVAVLAGIPVFRWSPGSAQYQGKAVRAWAAQLYSPSPPAREEAGAALKSMEPRAVPELIQMLQAKDSVFRKVAWSIPKILPARLRR
jgi:hypothetical protein